MDLNSQKNLVTRKQFSNVLTIFSEQLQSYFIFSTSLLKTIDLCVIPLFNFCYCCFTYRQYCTCGAKKSHPINFVDVYTVKFNQILLGYKNNIELEYKKGKLSFLTDF